MPRAEILTKQPLHTLTQLHAELARKIEAEVSITNKLKWGTFSATFFLACIAAMELERVVLEEI